MWVGLTSPSSEVKHEQAVAANGFTNFPDCKLGLVWSTLVRQQETLITFLGQ
jgi:hypothetical protein